MLTTSFLPFLRVSPAHVYLFRLNLLGFPYACLLMGRQDPLYRESEQNDEGL